MKHWRASRQWHSAICTVGTNAIRKVINGLRKGPEQRRKWWIDLLVSENQVERWRLGVVSFLNAKPLIEGLEADPNLTLLHEVPSRLAGMLDAGAVDVALVPVVDLMSGARRWQIVSDACIGCDGETLTVRVFSRVPPQSIARLHVDGDSHTSVMLASVVWRELFNSALEIVPFTGEETVEECEGVLLIGDKVVNNRLVDYDIETDLGSCWKTLTGLPFVFAVWAGPEGKDYRRLARLLSQARDAGVRSAEMIAADYGPGLNWPVTLAKRYLTKRLKFDLGPRQREAMSLFLTLARKHGLVEPEQELVYA
jgi:chorismate dehydratase